MYIWLVFPTLGFGKFSTGKEVVELVAFLVGLMVLVVVLALLVDVVFWVDDVEVGL